VWSNRYWLGINPFSLISAIDITVTVSGAKTLISVSINRLRAVSISIAGILFLIIFDMAVSVPLVPRIAANVLALGWFGIGTRWAHALVFDEIMSIQCGDGDGGP
jgi:hypothetical protein